MAQPQSQDHTSVWWPEDRIKATLDTKYVLSRLRPENVPRLFDLPRWGEGLTSETYMEWILLKAGRLFLILDTIGIPDRIFALVDESCDDDDLPIAEQNVDRLRLSPVGKDLALDTKFFHAQWRYLVRGIQEGEHVTYTQNEGVPVEVIRTTTGSGVQGRDDTADKVVLAGAVCRAYLRTQIQVGGAPHFFSAAEVLEEIRGLRKLAHQHVISIYASYFVDDTVCALFTGAETDRTLHSFLTDEPPAFKRQSKEFRRQTLITWPHCLASAVAWLHARGHAHAAIRPSNILIDPNYHIYLGQFQALDSLLAPPRVNDLEAYQYSAPERWVRTAAPTIQPTVPSKTILPSGGRTGRRKKPPRLALSTLKESPPTSPDFPRPDSAASKGTVIRIGLPGSPSRFSFTFSSSSSSSSAASTSGYTDSSRGTTLKHHRSAIWSRPKALLSTPSITSSNSSSSSSVSTTSLVTPSPTRPTPVSTNLPAINPSQPSLHTWHSTQTNPTAADLFSLAAVTLDILTHLCKRTLSSFTSHRSARNRSAGRGGGMADASFHLDRNAVQVQSWIALLEGDALKRCRRDRGSDRAYHAVPRMLIVLRAMLAVEPEKRPAAKRVKKSFASAIREVSSKGGEGMTLHCSEADKEERRRRRKVEAEMAAQKERKMKEETEMKENRAKEAEDAAKEDTFLDSSSVSEFDFGFTDAGSDSETNEDREDLEDVVDRSILEEEDVPVRVNRVSPKLSLPNLDVNIRGIEGLTFRSG
ncbi:protein kinase domain-containing protein [Penicillium brasilianum]|uniref:Protein kinase domain-containing protein n=1 Tax=Penicillium brasilianum TaxID=104259 RepID=A0A1S9RZS3_PENBI|nr:protein kinase domain-containing protein [Penicillium brasilianum]